MPQNYHLSRHQPTQSPTLYSRVLVVSSNNHYQTKWWRNWSHLKTSWNSSITNHPLLHLWLIFGIHRNWSVFSKVWHRKVTLKSNSSSPSIISSQIAIVIPDIAGHMTKKKNPQNLKWNNQRIRSILLLVSWDGTKWKHKSNGQKPMQKQWV